ncbi:MAG: hypothetical protein ONB46_03835 [candidate division KSB1 bacterium]|nr:hypothetical protein [candidate division KSB1 bacterium]MDZ7364948.1 hypothetical protein [candidate division KSB1 bacterium]MDZ7403343.1 hypothetical protein [candidate division KSB1 bacterium]
MKLGQIALEKLNAIRQDKKLPEADQNSASMIEEKNESFRLCIEIEDFDKFSFVIKTLSVARLQAPPNMSLTELLQRQAGEIERRLSYLQERFRLVELDEFNVLAQVRSAAPYQKNGERFYYELLLQHGNSVTLTRYRKSATAEKRELVPFHLTPEMLERLVDDLAATLHLV